MYQLYGRLVNTVNHFVELLVTPHTTLIAANGSDRFKRVDLGSSRGISLEDGGSVLQL
jgi:hypothetical protein